MFKKAAVIAIAVIVIVSCCCIPVSAAEVEQSPLEFLGEFSKNNSSLLWNVAINGVGATGTPFKPIGLVKGGEGTQNEYWYANYKLPIGGGNYDAMAFAIMPFTQKVYLNKGDRFYLSFRVKYQFGPVKPSSFSIGLTADGYDYLGPNGSSFYREGTTVPITDDGYVYHGNVTIDFIAEEESVIDGIILRWSRDGWSGYETTWGFGIISPIILLSGNPDDIALQQKIDDLTAEQEETNNKLDEILKQPEQEKQEAGGSGNDAIDGLTSAIPADNDGVIAAMRKLSAAMSYTGTECKWKFPALYIPAIDGVTPRIDLTGEKDINFTEWINAMPADVIEVVRIIATIALILYCFKELYNLIKYILTMKGGGGGNE